MGAGVSSCGAFSACLGGGDLLFPERYQTSIYGFAARGFKNAALPRWDLAVVAELVDAQR